jgi:hypothetical protein
MHLSFFRRRDGNNVVGPDFTAARGSQGTDGRPRSKEGVQETELSGHLPTRLLRHASGRSMRADQWIDPLSRRCQRISLTCSDVRPTIWQLIPNSRQA